MPWQPKGDGVDSTAFVMPPDLGVKGRVKPPPGLSRVEEEEEENEQLEDLGRESLFKISYRMTVLTVRLQRSFMNLQILERMHQRKQGLIQMLLRLSL